MVTAVTTADFASLTTKPATAKVLCVPRTYETIQGAIDAASDGDCISLSNGVHTLCEPLLVDKCVHIICGDEGSTGVVIRLDTTTGKLLRPSSHMLVIDCPSCRIADVTIEHIGSEPDPTTLTFAVWCRRGCPIFDQCNIVSNMHSAVGVNEGTFPTFKRCSIAAKEYGSWVGSGKIRLDRCSITAHRGTYCDAQGSADVENSKYVSCTVGVECLDTCSVDIHGTSFIDPGEAGVYCAGSAGSHQPQTVRLDTNRFISTQAEGGGAGVDAVEPTGVVVDAAKPIVHKNTFDGCSLSIRNRGQGVYTFNTIQRAKVGVRVCGRSNPVLKQNTFDGCDTGVVVSGKLTQGAFTSNEFVGNKTAVQVADCANPSLVANRVGKAAVGLDFVTNGRGNVRGNDVYSCTTGVQLRDAADPFLEQNQVQDCTFGISVNHAKGKILSNSVLRSEETGVVLSGSQGTWLEDNRVGECGKEGFLAVHTSSATLLTNRVCGSKLAAIQCSEDCKSTIQLQGNEFESASF